MSEGAAGPFLFLRRRRLLKLGVAGVALVGGGVVVGARAMRGHAPSVDGLRTLSAHEYRTMASIARAQFPSGKGPFAVGADDLDIARTFDAFLADEGPDNVSDLKTALALVEYGPVVFDLRATTFSNLDDVERDAHWRAWVESDSELRRKVATAFRKFILLVGFDRPEVWPSINYAGPSLWGMPK